MAWSLAVGSHVVDPGPLPDADHLDGRLARARRSSSPVEKAAPAASSAATTTTGGATGDRVSAAARVEPSIAPSITPMSSRQYPKAMVASPSSVRSSPSAGAPGGPQRIVPMCWAVSSSESPRSRLSRITAFTAWNTSLNLPASASGVSPATGADPRAAQR